jgi:hypothetical protein
MITHTFYEEARQATGSTANNLSIMIEINSLSPRFKAAAIKAARRNLHVAALEYRIDPAVLYILQNKKGPEA